MMSHIFMPLADVASAAPAKGAPVSDLLWASLVAAVLTGALLWVATAHRSGRISWLGNLADVRGADRRRVPTALRLTDDWHAPLGGVMIFVVGAFALLGFPLDDVWHTLFGQDVTLWGPTHILMVGGASLSTLGMWVLLVE